MQNYFSGVCMLGDLLPPVLLCYTKRLWLMPGAMKMASATSIYPTFEKKGNFMHKLIGELLDINFVISMSV